MHFNAHSELMGKHAFLSPSNHHWLKYDDNKLKSAYISQLAKLRGTQLHELGSKCINLGVYLPDNGETLSMYVNDAIDLGLKTEQPLFYSYNCYGTADAIGIYNNILHIHDYKSGSTPTSMNQLIIYAALFFLEYGVLYSPQTTPVELRIYQSNNVSVSNPTPTEIYEVMDKIIHFDELIRESKGAY